MRPVAVLELLALERVLSVVAIGSTACQKCSRLYHEIDYFRKSGLATGADPPPPPNPRPRPPLPLPAPPRPPPGVQPASNDLWDKAGAKGCTLGWAMQTSDREAGALYVPIRDSAESAYDSTADLQRWLWFPYPEEKVADSFHDLYATWGIGWALKDLGLSDYTTEYEGGKNNLISIAHQSYEPNAPDVNQQWYEVDNTWYRATGASYSFVINPDDGIIIGLNRESPRYAAPDRNPPVAVDQLPKLNQFSDVSWIIWKAMHRPPWSSETRLNHLKYFMSVSVTNKETQQILKRALEANHWELSEWPGHTFEMIWPETKAILGSPNVQGFAYFLIQHKEQLGNKFIDKIQVFRGETKAELPCILVHVRQPLGPSAEVGTERRDKNNVLRVHTFRANL